MADDITSKGIFGKAIDWLFPSKPAETAEHEKYKAARSFVLSGVGTPEQEKIVKDYEARGGSISTPAPVKSTTGDTEEDTGGGGGGSFAGEDQATNIVANLAKNYGIDKAIQLATSQYGIPYQAAILALNSPMGRGAVQDFKRTVSNLNPFKKKGAYSYSPVTGDGGTGPAILIDNQGIMAAGQQALGQTQPQIAAQVAAAQATQQDNYQAPTMSQQQMVQEAQQTGGTVNPHEATQAAWTPPPSQPVYGPHGKAHGGVVSLMDLLNRRI